LTFQSTLKKLNEKDLRLEDLPEPLQRVTYQYARMHHRLSDLEGRFPGDVVAAALLDVWDRRVKRQLAQQSFDPQRWITVLIPVAQYIGPAAAPHIEISLVEDNITDLARYRLLDMNWVCQIVGDEAIAERVVEFARGEYQQNDGVTLKPVSRTYHNWRKKGIEILETAVLSALEKPIDRGARELELPEYFVSREQVLGDLRESVLETSRTGGWVAVVGTPGTGKRTLLAALARDSQIQAEFPDGVIVEEITAGVDAKLLAMRLAISLGKPLPYWIRDEENLKEAQGRLHDRLVEMRALLVIANVTSLDVLAGLPALDPGVVGVMSVRSLDIVHGMGVDRQIHLGGLTESESWQLAQKVSGLDELNLPETEAAHRVLELLEYHPNAVRIAAVRAAMDGWTRLEAIIQDARARLMALGNVREEQLNVWTPLEAWWDEEDEQIKVYFAMVGYLPLLKYYDDKTGAAVWGVSEAEAGAIWGQLARMQLVDVLDGTRGNVPKQLR